MNKLIQGFNVPKEKRKFGILLFFVSVALAIGICANSTAKKEPPEKCANCHSDSPAFKEWQKSAHVNALKTFLKEPDANKSCLKCHSATYQRFNSNPWLSLNELPEPGDASDPVSCSACHQHKSGLEDNLIMPADEMCISCHILYCGG